MAARKQKDDKPPEGKPDKRASAAEKVARDHEIVRDRARGLSVPRVAAKYGVSEATVKRAWAEHAAASQIEIRREPLAIVWEMVARYEAQEERLAELAENADNDSAVVGAIRAQSSIMQQRAELLQSTGFLPRQLGDLRVVADIRFVMEQIIAVLREDNVPLETQRKMARVLKEAAQ